MTEKTLQERLDLLKAERERVRLTVFAYDGAIQECEYWLKSITALDTQNGFPGAEVVEFPKAEN